MRLREAIFLSVLAVTLGSCSNSRSNDTGGIIPWSPEAALNARDIAQANCARYGQYAVIDAVVRGYGNYISYRCQWYPPRGGGRRR